MKFIGQRFCVCVLFCVLAIGAQAQKDNNKLVANLKGFDEKPIHFGFLIGINTMNFSIQHSGQRTFTTDPSVTQDPVFAEVLSLQPGINLGIITSFRLRKNLNLRILPGISFGQRDLSYISTNGIEEEEPLQIKSTFLEAPIMLKYGADRNHNFKPYIVAGINPRFDLAKRKQGKVLLNALDFYYEIGAGFDSYLNYFRLSTELKISIGMRDILNHDTAEIEPINLPYSQAIDKLTSRIFVLSFYFE